MKMATKHFQGDPTLLKVRTAPISEDNNRNFSRGSPTEIIFFLISLVKVVSVPLTEGENGILQGVTPLRFFWFLWYTGSGCH